MEKLVETWWYHMPGNFGDIITPYLINTLTDYTALFHHALPTNDNPQPLGNRILIGAGSTANFARGGTVMWGTGLMNADSGPTAPKLNSMFLSVRGPITRDILANTYGVTAPAIYGDPAMLLPMAYDPADVEPEFEYGFFGHYNDTARLKQWYDGVDGVTVIDPTINDPDQPPQMVKADHHGYLTGYDTWFQERVDQLKKCKRIISSSLHGVIVAHAYGIPVAWARHGGSIDGDGTKYADHYAAVGIDVPECVRLVKSQEMSVLDNLHYTSDIKLDTTPILTALQDFLDKKTQLDSE